MDAAEGPTVSKTGTMSVGIALVARETEGDGMLVATGTWVTVIPLEALQLVPNATKASTDMLTQALVALPISRITPHLPCRNAFCAPSCVFPQSLARSRKYAPKAS